MQDNDLFYEHLIQMYLQAPVNHPFEPVLKIDDASARLIMKVKTQHFHSAHYLHGSIIFKALDDSAFFAAQSIEPEFFVVTSTFNSHFIRPVNKGHLIAIGSVISQTKSRIIAESKVFDDNDKLIAHGSGVFSPSRSRLNDIFQ
tara:strand:- start:3428 stop:3859 length:432 start_codon:yes stop_codon:yes gene_type:complete